MILLKFLQSGQNLQTCDWPDQQPPGGRKIIFSFAPARGRLFYNTDKNSQNKNNQNVYFFIEK